MRFSTCRVLTVTGLTAAALLSSAVASAETFPLKIKRLETRSSYESREEDPDFLFRMSYPQSFWMRDGAVQSREQEEPSFDSLVKKEPEKYQCGQPFRAVARLGSDTFPFALDSSDLSSQGYDVLYFDRDRDGDLTDEEPVRAMPPPENVRYPEGYANREFPRIDFKVNGEGTTFDYGCFFRVYSQMREGIPSYAGASLNTAACRDGEITLEGKRHRVVLLDFNSNGRFDDKFSINPGIRTPDSRAYPGQGDMFIIDPDTSNRYTYGYGATQRKERQPVSNLLFLDGRFYEVKISPAGDSLTLTPSAVPTGAVRNPNEHYAAMVYDEKGAILKISGRGGERVPLPEGKWKLLDYVIQEDRSDKSPTWLSAQGKTDYPAVAVQKGETAELPFGPPYKPVVTVSRISGSESERTAQMDMALVGSTGEICTNVMVKGNRPEKPTFAIANPKGRIVERGNFEYG